MDLTLSESVCRVFLCRTFQAVGRLLISVRYFIRGVLLTYPLVTPNLFTSLLRARFAFVPPRNFSLTVPFEYALHCSVSVLQGPHVFPVNFFCSSLYHADSTAANGGMIDE
jgi:hypothetical protein